MDVIEASALITKAAIENGFFITKESGSLESDNDFNSTQIADFYKKMYQAIYDSYNKLV